MLAVKLIFGRTYTEDIILLELYCRFWSGARYHNFPFYLKFKGGKELHVTGGMVLAVFPIVAPVSMGLFLVISAVTKYVSLGSIIGLISVFVQVVVYGQLGIITVPMGIRAEFYIVYSLVYHLGYGSTVQISDVLQMAQRIRSVRKRRSRNNFLIWSEKKWQMLQS